MVGQQAKEVLDAIDENCPTILQFKKYAQEMDAKHDKYERIVKISRDVTIESKRIIFLLHTIDRYVLIIAEFCSLSLHLLTSIGFQ